MINIKTIARCPLFEGLDDSDINSVAAIMTEKRVGEGMSVFLENMSGESLFLIERGTVRISKMIAEGEERTLVILSADDFFGEMAILDGSPRSATARVVEEATLWCIKKNDFDQLCDSQPKLGIKLMKNIVKVFTRRVRSSNEELRDIILWKNTGKSC